MTTLTGRVPLAEVSRRARQIRFGRTMLTLVTGLLFGAGWLAAKVFALAWLALAWGFTSARMGWQHAQLRARVPRLSLAEQADLVAEAERLRAEVARLRPGG